MCDAPLLSRGRTLDADPSGPQTLVRRLDVVDLNRELEIVRWMGGAFLNPQVEAAPATDTEVPVLLREHLQAQEIGERNSLGGEVRRDHEYVAEAIRHGATLPCPQLSRR